MCFNIKFGKFFVRFEGFDVICSVCYGGVVGVDVVVDGYGWECYFVVYVMYLWCFGYYLCKCILIMIR